MLLGPVPTPHPRACLQIRPDRQTLLWSATWPKEVQAIARDFLKDPYQVRAWPRRCVLELGCECSCACVGYRAGGSVSTAGAESGMRLCCSSAFFYPGASPHGLIVHPRCSPWPPSRSPAGDHRLARPQGQPQHPAGGGDGGGLRQVPAPAQAAGRRDGRQAYPHLRGDKARLRRGE